MTEEDCRFDQTDPRFRAAQRLFEKQRPEKARALLRELIDEWRARASSPQEERPPRLWRFAG